ncbi:MAG: trigger factor [Patescibacteria group bacterium]
MKVESKNLPKSQLELSVELSANELAPYFDAAAAELSRQNSIKGFRPGFAPKDVVARELGQDKLKRLAFDLAIKEKSNEIIAARKISPVGDVKINKVAPQENGGLEFVTAFSVIPRIDPGDYKKIKVPVEEIKVDEAEIKTVLDDIRKSRAENSAVDRPAQKGDRVEIDFSVKKDGVLVDGGESKQHPLVLGEGHFIDGFENNLVGLKEGESKSFFLTAPVDYQNKDLAGKKIDFEVKMNLVQERKIPEISDEFAKSLGRFASAEDLKKNVAEGVKAEKELKAKEKQRAQIVEALVKNIDAEIPLELTQLELSKMTAELADSLARMNMTLENYLNHIAKTPEELKKDWEPQAEKRVKASLVLKEIAAQENIQVSDSEIEERLNHTLRSAPPLAPGQNLDLTALRGYVKNVIRNEKVFELLESN